MCEKMGISNAEKIHFNRSSEHFYSEKARASLWYCLGTTKTTQNSYKVPKGLEGICYMYVPIENGNVDRVIVRSCGHILNLSLDLLPMEPFTISLIFLAYQIAKRRNNSQNNDRRGYEQFL